MTILTLVSTVEAYYFRQVIVSEYFPAKCLTGLFPDIDYEDDYTTDAPHLSSETDWLIDLLGLSSKRDYISLFHLIQLCTSSLTLILQSFFFSSLGACTPSPCMNGGSCHSLSSTEFKCSCVEPYVGLRCQTGKKEGCKRQICQNQRRMISVKCNPKTPAAPRRTGERFWMSSLGQTHKRTNSLLLLQHDLQTWLQYYSIKQIKLNEETRQNKTWNIWLEWKQIEEKK